MFYQKSCGVESVHQKSVNYIKNYADFILFLELNLYLSILWLFNVLKRKLTWKKEKYDLVYSKLKIYVHLFDAAQDTVS